MIHPVEAWPAHVMHKIQEHRKELFCCPPQDVLSQRKFFKGNCFAVSEKEPQGTVERTARDYESRKDCETQS